jgi:hypothetical protein
MLRTPPPPSYLLYLLTYSDWCRYAIDVNVERAEDVLTHMRLLDKATRPENQPAFSVRVVQVRCDSCTSLQFALCCTDKFHVFFFSSLQVPVPTEDDAGEPDSSQSNPTEHDTAATPTRLTYGLLMLPLLACFYTSTCSSLHVSHCLFVSQRAS